MREENEQLKTQYYKQAGNIEQSWFMKLRNYLDSRQRVKVNIRMITFYYIEMFLCFAMG